MRRMFFHFSLFLVFAASACTPYTYVPNAVNVTCFSNAKELQVTPLCSFTRFELQAAYSLTPHAGLVLNNHISKRVTFAEAGAGWMSSCDKKLRLEVFGGAGAGRNHANFVHWYDEDSEKYPLYYVNNKYARFFLQPGVVYVNGGFSAGIGMRCSYLAFSRYEYKEITYVSFNIPRDTVYYAVHPGKRSLALEPGIVLRMGKKRVQFTVQAGSAVYFFNDDRTDQKDHLNAAPYLVAGVFVPFRLGKEKVEQ